MWASANFFSWTRRRSPSKAARAEVGLVAKRNRARMFHCVAEPLENRVLLSVSPSPVDRQFMPAVSIAPPAEVSSSIPGGVQTGSASGVSDLSPTASAPAPAPGDGDLTDLAL